MSLPAELDGFKVLADAGEAVSAISNGNILGVQRMAQGFGGEFHFGNAGTQISFGT